jgi:hypothetical protein
MMMAPPAVPMVVMVAYLNHHLCTRSGYQWCQERKRENSNRKLLHAHGKQPLLFLNPLASSHLPSSGSDDDDDCTSNADDADVPPQPLPGRSLQAPAERGTSERENRVQTF